MVVSNLKRHQFFLDVDDLRAGKGGEHVLMSYSVVVFLPKGYFTSMNCLRELRAVWPSSSMYLLLCYDRRSGDDMTHLLMYENLMIVRS